MHPALPYRGSPSGAANPGMPRGPRPTVPSRAKAGVLRTTSPGMPRGPLSRSPGSQCVARGQRAVGPPRRSGLRSGGCERPRPRARVGRPRRRRGDLGGRSSQCPPLSSELGGARSARPPRGGGAESGSQVGGAAPSLLPVGGHGADERGARRRGRKAPRSRDASRGGWSRAALGRRGAACEERLPRRRAWPGEVGGRR